MTEKEKMLIYKAKNINERIKQLNIEIQLLQQEYINIANELFDSIEDKKELKKEL